MSDLESQLTAVYSAPDATDYSKFSSALRYAAVWTYRPVRPGAVDPYDVLDLGCGLGGFAQFSRLMGYPLGRYLGIEAREDTRVLARQGASAEADVFAASLPVADNASDASGAFDLILALGLISRQLSEHAKDDIDDYLGLLEGAGSLLRSGGRLYVTLRTREGAQDQDGCRYLVFDAAHLADRLKMRIVFRMPLFTIEEFVILERAN